MASRLERFTLCDSTNHLFFRERAMVPKVGGNLNFLTQERDKVNLHNNGIEKFMNQPITT